MTPPKRKTAGDIMLPASNFPLIYEDETIKRALTKFQFILPSQQGEKHVLVVINRKDEPIGWFALQDLLRVILGSGYKNQYNLSQLTGPYASFARIMVSVLPDDWDKLSEQCCRVADRHIGAYCRPLEKDAVDVNAGIKQVASLMNQKNLYIMPVVEKGKLRGFIRSEDIILEMGKELAEAPFPGKTSAIPVAHSP